MEMRKLLVVLLLGGSVLLSSTHEEKLTSINQQIDELEKKLEKLKKEKKSVLNEIYEIELKHKKESIENQKVTIQLTNTLQEIKKKRHEKEELRKRIQASKDNIGKALRVLYKLGRSSYIKFFISVESLNELFRNYHLFVSLINYKSDEINKLKKNILKLEKVDKELQSQVSNLVDLRKLKEQKLQQIEILKQDKWDLVSRINSDRRGYLKLLDELKREAANLDNMIKSEVETRSQSRGLTIPIPLVSIQQIRGKLRWPLNGKVISTFGKKRSTEFDTYIINNGIEIKPTGTDKIEAVYAGEVVFADYFKGYGNLIIIEHAKNFHSLYGHCEKILKEKGERVTEGELIAMAGDTGSTYGKSLYLEIRKDLKPENPLKWLLKK